MAKTRPVVIVSLDELNARSPVVTVCPLTTNIHPNWRGRLQVTVDGKPAEVAVDHIRSLSTTRLGQRLGSLSAAKAAALRRIITEMYGQ